MKKRRQVAALRKGAWLPRSFYAPKRCARNYPWHPCNPWSASDRIQRFNDLTAAKQFVFIRVYSWLTFADGCG
jgi:hypothetical protein